MMPIRSNPSKQEQTPSPEEPLAHSSHTTFEGCSVVVLGGTGFIGCKIVRRLVSLGADVTAATTDLSHASALGDVKGHVKVVQTDLRNRQQIDALVKGKQYLFNFAGTSGAVASGKSPVLNLEVNGRGVLNLLEACRELSPHIRLLFPGSRLQYGKPHYLPVDESHPMNPTSIYGVHKMLGEKYHLLYHRNYGLRATVVRISNVYGPDERKRERKNYNIINQFARAALAGEELKIFGAGTQMRDYIYARDLVEAVLSVAQASVTVGQVYNVGSGHPIRFVDMVRMIIAHAGQGHLVYTPWPPEAKTVETGDFYFSIDRLRQAIDWQPAYTLERGITEMLETLRRTGYGKR
jgi:nucleoside-diphosphate-sugar epimerase